MKLIRTLTELGAIAHPVVLAAGFFDGVHRGHQRVLQAAIDEARRIGGEAWVLTFDTHPMRVLNPGSAPLMLTSTEHKTRLIRACGVDGCILHAFNRDVASQTAEDFAMDLAHDAPTLAAVVVGDNWRFGAGGKGTPQLLRELGADKDLKVITVEPVVYHGDTISSTRLRQAVMKGKLDAAADMLGRPASVLGTVVHGHKIGRKLGFPSANMDPHNEALPPLGVYAVMAIVNGKLVDGVLNFGTRPTFTPDADSPATVELHLLDFDDDVYGNDIEAFFIAHLREEWYFSSIEELKEQITVDVQDARHVLKESSWSKNLKEYLYTAQTPVL